MDDLLCKCTQQRGLERFATSNKFDLNGGRYTSFQVFKCLSCNKATFFPTENGELALKEGTERCLRELKECIEMNAYKESSYIGV
jgi:hypothetical protein